MKFTKQALDLIKHTIEYGESSRVNVTSGRLSYLRKIVSNYNTFNEIKVSVKKLTNESVILMVNKSKISTIDNPFTVVNLNGLPQLKKVLKGEFYNIDMDGLFVDIDKIKNIAFSKISDRDQVID